MSLLVEKRVFVYKKVLETTKKLYKDDPFFGSHYDDVLKEIYDLLSKRRFTSALEACQLFILLLTKEKRRRFHLLVKFLHVCFVTKEIRLSADVKKRRNFRKLIKNFFHFLINLGFKFTKRFAKFTRMFS